MARRRRGNGKSTFECGHVGLGTTCHRCEQGNKLLALVNSGKKYETCLPAGSKKNTRVWSKEETLEEARRLLEENKRY